MWIRVMLAHWEHAVEFFKFRFANSHLCDDLQSGIFHSTPHALGSLGELGLNGCATCVRAWDVLSALKIFVTGQADVIQASALDSLPIVKKGLIRYAGHKLRERWLRDETGGHTSCRNGSGCSNTTLLMRLLASITFTSGKARSTTSGFWSGALRTHWDK